MNFIYCFTNLINGKSILDQLLIHQKSDINNTYIMQLTKKILNIIIHYIVLFENMDWKILSLKLFKN